MKRLKHLNRNVIGDHGLLDVGIAVASKLETGGRRELPSIHIGAGVGLPCIPFRDGGGGWGRGAGARSNAGRGQVPHGKEQQGMGQSHAGEMQEQALHGGEGARKRESVLLQDLATAGSSGGALRWGGA